MFNLHRDSPANTLKSKMLRNALDRGLSVVKFQLKATMMVQRPGTREQGIPYRIRHESMTSGNRDRHPQQISTPEKLTMDHIRKQGITGSKIPLTNLNSVTVPGAAAAWVDTVETFGSGKVTLSEVLEPAIRLAEEG